MAADAVELHEFRVFASHGEPFRQFALLLDREQDVRAHADDERPLELQPLEPAFQRPAVISQVEQVRRM